MVSNERILEITNIHWSAEGIYTCVATQPCSGATINITVKVTVQCECQAKLSDSTPVYRESDVLQLVHYFMYIYK